MTTPAQAMRAAFEAWARSTGYRISIEEGGMYWSDLTDAAWDAWQAATAAALARAEGAERERDALRECVKAADAMRGYAPNWLQASIDYDAARAATAQAGGGE